MKKIKLTDKQAKEFKAIADEYNKKSLKRASDKLFTDGIIS